MLPELFRIPGLDITVYAYSVILTAALGIGLYLTASLAESNGLPRDKIYSVGLYLLPLALAGTKLPAISRSLASSGARGPVGLPALVSLPGFYFGGFLAALAASVVVLRVLHPPWLRTADAVAPGLAVGNILGRVGCFAGGCCWGKPTAAWYGVQFSDRAHELTGVPLGLAVVPTQLMDASANLLILTILMRLWKKRLFPGQVFLAYAGLYSIERFVVEFWRADPRGHAMGLSMSQLISCVLLLAAVALYLHLSHRCAHSPPPSAR